MTATKMAHTKGYNIECINCHNSIKVSPPRPEYEIILTQPCPMCDGLEQSLTVVIVTTNIHYIGTKDTSLVRRIN